MKIDNPLSPCGVGFSTPRGEPPFRKGGRFDSEFILTTVEGFNIKKRS